MNVSKNISDALKKSGWHPQRKVNADEIVSVLSEEGYSLNELEVDFFENFAFLEIEHPAFRVEGQFDRMHLNPIEACANIYRERVETYENRTGESLVVIGEIYSGHLTLMLSHSGKVYGGYDNFLTLLGESFEAALENIFNKRESNEIP